jgi:urease accessory protein UreF
MDKLYPEAFTAEMVAEVTKVEEKEVKDTSKLKEFIKELVKEPMVMSDIIVAVDAKYCETNDEAYHFLGEEIQAVCAEIESEWRPEEEAAPVEPVEEIIK